MVVILESSMLFGFQRNHLRSWSFGVLICFGAPSVASRNVKSPKSPTSLFSEHSNWQQGQKDRVQALVEVVAKSRKMQNSFQKTKKTVW